jgi:hypothetical protein
VVEPGLPQVFASDFVERVWINAANQFEPAPVLSPFVECYWFRQVEIQPHNFIQLMRFYNALSMFDASDPDIPTRHSTEVGFLLIELHSNEVNVGG